MPHDKIDSLADDVKALVLKLQQQNSGLMARIDDLIAQNKALLARSHSPVWRKLLQARPLEGFF